MDNSNRQNNKLWSYLILELVFSATLYFIGINFNKYIFVILGLSLSILGFLSLMIYSSLEKSEVVLCQNKQEITK